jgi:hypothetical protein
VTVDPNLKRPYGQEISGHVERELLTGLSGRVSYVYKNIRNDWAEVDLSRLPAYTIPFTPTDPLTGATLNLLTRAAGVPERRVFTNPTDPEYTSDYHTVDFAVNRRFRGRWMAITSFTFSWLNQFNDREQASTNALEAVDLGKTYRWRPNERLFGKERTTLWNYKLIGRYVFRWDIGVSGSYKLQSGLNWGRTLSISVPNAGTETVRVEPANANRAPNVGIMDVRLDKTFDLGGRRGRITGMVDVFNLLNDDVVTNFRIQSGSISAAQVGAVSPRFKEIIGLLDPRIVRFGVRYEF